MSPVNPTNIKIEDYNYQLPDNKIAKYPLKQRDLSKLLIMNKGKISESTFQNIPKLLPKDSFLLFNETRVIQARLIFKKNTGATIEIFCLEPIKPTNDFQIALQQKPPVIWKCLVGNARRWKEGHLETNINLNGQDIKLRATIEKKLASEYLISFSWEPGNISFADILENSGLTPLPPYLHRKAEISDKKRYQTIYAKLNGSVAAPTAGLHFTKSLLEKIKQKGFDTDNLILHVGAGTFKPVSSDTIGEHKMHTEQIQVQHSTLKHLLHSINKNIIPVGTTSMRSLESLFWMGLRLKINLEPFNVVSQWDPYKLTIPENFSPEEALKLLINKLDENNEPSIKGETQLIIAPGYKFRFAKGLITNFHQPKSTLLLLVSALVGEDWRKAYDYALENNFRFLSYGDSCLFIP